MSSSGSGLDIALKALNRVNRGLIAVTKGRLGWTFRRNPIVDFHTVGRRSGEKRSTLLLVPVREGQRLVLVASRGGDTRHPHWYLNLLANPNVEVTFKGETRAMVARTATEEEKAQLWPRIVRAYPGYEQYQKRTSRDIPVVICEPERARPND